MLTSLVFIICTYILNTGAADENLECPTISDGYYPLCVCKHGPVYDFETNTCPDPECPIDESVGVYPNCTCQYENFDYSRTLNECFRVCPENSSGYWPKCNCSDGYVFQKREFKCIACPENSTGQYPDCICAGNGNIYDIYNNDCKESTSCPYGSNGKYPNCTCAENGGVYNELTNECDECPYGSTGIYPNCNCKEGYTYADNACYSCPFEVSVGLFPNCVCVDRNSTYIKDSNSCFACPPNSTGEYPNCDCKHPFDKYVQKDNNCVGCPDNTEGIFPNCSCLNGYFSQAHRRCIECPPDATGSYPACKCDDENLVFSAFINQCYRGCPENSSGIQPNCRCDDTGYYYDSNDIECKSNTGRICPFDSIGIGPDCLCIRKDQRFYAEGWYCLNERASFSDSTKRCPSNGKWPQCEDSIDFNVLRSAVG